MYTILGCQKAGFCHVHFDSRIFVDSRIPTGDLFWVLPSDIDCSICWFWRYVRQCACDCHVTVPYVAVFVVKLRLTGPYVVMLSLSCGFHFMMWSYFTENRARAICPREVQPIIGAAGLYIVFHQETTVDLFYPRTIECFMKSNFQWIDDF